MMTQKAVFSTLVLLSVSYLVTYVIFNPVVTPVIAGSCDCNGGSQYTASCDQLCLKYTKQDIHSSLHYAFQTAPEMDTDLSTNRLQMNNTSNTVTNTHENNTINPVYTTAKTNWGPSKISQTPAADENNTVNPVDATDETNVGLLNISQTRINKNLNSIVKRNTSSILSQPKPPMIAVHKGWHCGHMRLGNRMFMLAASVAAAVTQNATFVFVHDNSNDCVWTSRIRDIFAAFSSTIPNISFSAIENWPQITETGFTEFDPIFLNGRNITTSGYRQSWKYFRTDVEKAAVRQLFELTPKYKTYATKAMGVVRNTFSHLKDPIIVGMHMRRGDLDRDSARFEFGYRMAGKTFYIQAMERATKHFNDSASIIFIAASDSLNDAKSLLTNVSDRFNIAWSNGTDFQDFAVLSKCKHSIISGGTFGFWTAWLAGGETFYFSGFAGLGTDFFKGFNSNNFYLSNWIPV